MYYEMINIMLNLYDQMVDYKQNFNHNEGIYFVVKVEGHNSGFENDGNTFHDDWACSVIKYFHVIILSNRNVFTCVSETEEMPVESDWTNSSNHESCFRSDGFQKLINVYFDTHKEIFANTPDEHTPAPIMDDVSLSLHHGFFGGPVFKFVRVEKERLVDGYHSKLADIKIIKKVIEM